MCFSVTSSLVLMIAFGTRHYDNSRSLHVEFTDVNSTVNVQFVTEIDFKSEYNNPSSLQHKSLKKDIQIQVSSNRMHSLILPGSYIVSLYVN